MRVLTLLPLLLAACAAPIPPGGNAVLAIGDSVMAWNGGSGIPEAVSARTGWPVRDAAQSGAHLSHPNAAAAALGFDVSRQFDGGSWDWVIMTGGGNDLRGECQTPAEAEILAGLIDADLTGELPDLIGQIRAAGPKVAYIGYYDGAEAEPTGFTPCQSAFDTINARMTRLAAGDPGLLFFDSGDVIDPADPSLYARDLIHPSPEGAAIIGAALGAAMLRMEGADPARD